MSEPRSLADLAVRALTPEQQRQVREQNLLSVMPQDVVMGFLATTNRQFRRLVRKVMILRNALVRTPRLRIGAIPLRPLNFWTNLLRMILRSFANNQNEWNG